MFHMFAEYDCAQSNQIKRKRSQRIVVNFVSDNHTRGQKPEFQIPALMCLIRAPLGGYFEPPLVFLRYLLNQCRYHHRTCSTLFPTILHIVLKKNFSPGYHSPVRYQLLAHFAIWRHTLAEPTLTSPMLRGNSNVYKNEQNSEQSMLAK